jgi:hypothetical protein
MIQPSFPVVAMLSLLLAGQALAVTDAERIAELSAQVEALTTRLEALEAAAGPRETAYAPPVVAAKPVSVPEWTERITAKGDFRYRHDSIRQDDADDRHRQRIRARAALIAQAGDDVEVGFGLASGGEDPGSANQSLGDGFSKKGVQLDLAYAKWATPVEGLALIGGKFRGPYFRPGGNQLIWDSDVNPEGISFAYADGALFGSAFGLWLN